MVTSNDKLPAITPGSHFGEAVQGRTTSGLCKFQTVDFSMTSAHGIDRW